MNLPFLLSIQLVGLLLFSGLCGAAAEQRLEVVGLNDKVEIIKDRWGIAHIYAKNQEDLFFAQGYNAASDRLFQFEIWRRRALGLMAEIQGEKALQHDIGARLLKFRGDLKQEMNHYHQDGEAIITSFVAGVNHYIEMTRDDPSLLPLEFGLLGIEPGYWTPEVVLSRHNALTEGADQEVILANLITALGAEKTREMLPFSREPYLQAKQGVELDEFSERVMALYKASRYPPTFTAEDLPGASPHQVKNDGGISTDMALMPSLDPFQSVNTIGSNNWIISGERTHSGSPILANDPHRRITAPSLRYWAHLVAPGWNVIGGGEPVLPGISIGHNEYGAWGLTIFPIDQEDLYVYDINPDNPNQYLYQGAWEDMGLIEEIIPVKGRQSEQVTLKYTRHGPVLYQDADDHKAYAIRAAWLETGGAPYLASLRINQAENWQEFRRACSYSGLPGENMIWADKEGNIGWQAVGLTPIRIGWDGLLPVPGDGRYEWAGFAPIQSMPHVLNPEEGHWQSANHNNIPEGYPDIFSFFSSDPFRLDRITEVLAQKEKSSIQDSIELQYDELSLPARSLVPLLKDIDVEDAITRMAVARLSRWDYTMDAESVEAAIYAQWDKVLQRSFFALIFPSMEKPPLPFIPKSKIIEWLVEPQRIFKEEPLAKRDELLRSSLTRAVQQLKQQFGNDINQWQYGHEDFNHIALTHPLSHAVSDSLKQQLDIGPLPKGGAMSTVNMHFSIFNQYIGPSFRMIVDTHDWDMTKGTNPPGQSGDPNSQHYRDLFDMWLQGEYFPAYYSREKIESVVAQTINLVPVD